MTTTKSPEETQATARLRALGQGLRVYCLEPGFRYCVPSAANDGSAYQVLVHDGDPSCTCQAALNDRYCKHLAAVTMRMEAEESLSMAQSLATVTDCAAPTDDDWERKVAELYS